MKNKEICPRGHQKVRTPKGRLVCYKCKVLLDQIKRKGETIALFTSNGKDFCKRGHSNWEIHTRKNGRTSRRCRICKVETQRRWYQDDLQRGVDSKFRQTKLKPYGLSAVDYELIKTSQNRVCAICRAPSKQFRNNREYDLHVDHDHETGQVRGLLCSKCNTALGLFKDDVALLQSAIEYLVKKRPCPPTPISYG